MTLLDDPAAGFLPPAHDVDTAFAAVIEQLRAIEPRMALPRVQRFERRLDAVETELLAARARVGASDADNEAAAGRGGSRSKSEAKKRADRAAALNENPELDDDLDNQWIALVACDRGCVLCGADPQYCEAHHILPWNAPARGRTDITNLVLLCSSCHHHTHDSKQTVTQDAETGTRRLRPATPEETPPPRAQPPP